MTTADAVREFVRMSAPPDMTEWLKTQPDWETAWKTCKRGDILMWVAGNWAEERGSLSHKQHAGLAVRCARLVSHLIPENWDSPHRGLKLVEEYAFGKASGAHWNERELHEAWSAIHEYISPSNGPKNDGVGLMEDWRQREVQSLYATSRQVAYALHAAANAVNSACYSLWGANYAPSDRACEVVANVVEAAGPDSGKILEQCADIVRAELPTFDLTRVRPQGWKWSGGHCFRTPVSDSACKLQKLGACSEMIRWAEDHPDTWGTYERGDHMIQIVGRIAGKWGSQTHRKIARVVGKCATLVLAYIPSDETRPKIALDLIARYGAGENIGQQKLRDVYDAIFRIADDAAAAAAMKTATARTACCAVMFAAAAACDGPPHGTVLSAELAVHDVGETFAWAKNGWSGAWPVLAQCADIIREEFPVIREIT